MSQQPTESIEARISKTERKRKSGVFLSVLGFGQGNLYDHLMQTLSQNGNGTAAHIDTLNEARIPICFKPICSDKPVDAVICSHPRLT